MADSLRKQLENFSLEEVRQVVEAIPKHIKSVTTKLQEERGIIIRGEGLKLTPEFLKSLNLKPKKVQEAEKALKIAAARKVEERAKDLGHSEAVLQPLFNVADIRATLTKKPVLDVLKELETVNSTSNVKKLSRLRTHH